MNFVGTGKRLAQGNVGRVARSINIKTAVLLALVEVETRGKGFDGENRPKILFEPHVFYRRLKGRQRAEAVRQGLAYRKWGAKRYPRTMNARYKQLQAAMVINKQAALESASWGLPQMMGFNYKKTGFASAEQMAKAMMQGEYEQLLAMATWLQNTGIAKHLRGKDFSKSASWVPAVSRYNGSGFRKNQYHIKAARAFVKHAGRGRNVVPITSGSLVVRFGMRGEAVRALQSDLKQLGYEIVVDGRFGPNTRLAVEQFQKGSTKVDGIAGQKTLDAIKVALAADSSQENDTIHEAKGKSIWVVILDFFLSILGGNK